MVGATGYAMQVRVPCVEHHGEPGHRTEGYQRRPGTPCYIGMTSVFCNRTEGCQFSLNNPSEVLL